MARKHAGRRAGKGAGGEGAGGEAPALPWRAVADGVRLQVRLTPKAARDRIEGVGEGPSGPVILARVRAVPEKGRANAALEALVAEWLGVPRSTVSVSSGGKSRVKSLLVSGETAEIIACVEAALEGRAGT